MDTSATYRLTTLGDLRLMIGAEEVLSGRRKELLLLAYLARRAPKPVNRDELAALLWGSRDDAKARQSLRHALLQLRRAVPAALEITNESARVLEGRLELDANALEAEIAAGRPGEAVDRWQGDFLAGTEDSGDEGYRSWVESEREALRRLVSSAFSRLIRDASERSDIEAELAFARRFAEHFPLESQPVRLLIDALVRDGEIADAQTAYGSYEARLRAELDAAPSAELLRLGHDLERMRRASDERRPGSAALLTPDVVGRDAVLGSLLELWSHVRASPALVLIEGDEGIGKSRLCAELVRRIRAVDRSGPILEARALFDERDAAYALLRRLLAPLLQLAALYDAPNRALAEMSAIVPSLRERFPQLPAASGEPGRAESAVRDVLRVLAARSSLLVIVDDADNGDRPSRDVLLSLMREPPPGTMIVTVLRSEAVSTSPLAQELTRIPAARRVKLAPLTRQDLSSVLDSMIEMRPDDREVLIQRLAEESGGNPFFVLELVSAMADAGMLTLASSGKWRIDPALAAGELPLPLNVRAAIKTRLSALSEPARELLCRMAVSRAPVDLAAARQASGLGVDSFEAAFDELLTRRLVRSIAGTDGFEFAHELIRRVAAERARVAYPAVATIPPSAARPDEAIGSASRVMRRRVMTGIAVAAFLLVTVVGIAFRRQAATRGNRTIPRVAVLDLELVFPDSTEAYLAAGLSEEITSSLSRFDRIRLKSRGAVRTARSATMGDPVALGRRLGVDYLVEGSLQRVGDRLKVAVRLTKADDGFQVWGQDFEATAPDVPELHRRIATEVAARIGGRLSPTELSAIRRPLTANTRAFEHYLRGNHFLGRRTPLAVEQAIDEFRMALASDSTFGAAEARIAYGYSLFLDWGWKYHASREQLLRDGLALAARALERDSISADAWLSRAYLLVIQDPVGMSGALAAFERTIALDPGNTEAHYQYGQSLMALGRWNEARAAYRQAIALEPERAQTYVSLGSIERKQGSVALARRLYDSALVVDPGASYARSARAMLRLGEGDLRGGLEDAETAVRTTQGYAVPPRSVMAIALAKSGRLAEANREIAIATAAMADPRVPAPTDARWLGSALIAAGRLRDALDLLGRTRPRGAWLWFYCVASDFDPVRSDPRFIQIMKEAHGM